MGKILRVNLDSRKATEEPLNLKAAYNFLGGRGYGAYLLYNELKPKIGPLSPENKLVVMTGPFTGTIFPGAGRTAICSKSPLTGTIADSLMGGSFGVFLKRASFDGLVIEGKAERPVYLVVDDGNLSFGDASELWGKSVEEARGALLEKFPDSWVAAIGPAGENLCRFATISCYGKEGREGVAGRCGMGAVMGSKNLKAIVARGSAKIEISDEKNAQKLLKKIRGLVEAHPVTGSDGSLGRFGTGVLVHKIASAGLLPSFNFSGQKLDYVDVDPFSGETVREKYLVKRTACFACPTACGRYVKVGGWEGKGPEFETVVMLGPNSGFFKYDEIVLLGRLCDRLGLDTISAGALIGYLRGLQKVNTHQEAVEALMEMANGKSEFSLGLVAVAKKLKRAKVPAVKGLPMPAYDPRGAKGIALAYATSNRGACHLRAYTIAPEIYSSPEFVDPSAEDGKAALVKRMQDAYAIYDSLIACKFHGFALFATLKFELDDIAKLLTAVTGLDWTDEWLQEVGSRIYTIERMFNVREGFTAEDDTLPKEFGVDLRRMLADYYRVRGWSPSGVPRRLPPMKSVKRGKLGKLKLSPLEELKFPQLQVALDLDADMETVAKMAREVYLGGARIIEAGTPTIKRHGVENLIPRLREVAPEAILVADLKTMDVGNLEARISFRAGADVSAVLAIGGMTKIIEAVSEAIRWDKAVLIDFIDCPDPLTLIGKLANELKGHENRVIFCIHRGISEQLKGRGIHEQAQLITEAKRMAGGFPLAVAGGIKEGVARGVALAGADICIAGSAVYSSSNPRKTTAALIQEISQKR